MTVSALVTQTRPALLTLLATTSKNRRSSQSVTARLHANSHFRSSGFDVSSWHDRPMVNQPLAERASRHDRIRHRFENVRDIA